MATASSVSKTILPEAFTGPNDIESYSTHFELLAELQNWKRTARKTEFFFALFRLLPYPSKGFKRLLTVPSQRLLNLLSYDETVKVFQIHYIEKPVVFRGRLERRAQQAGGKLTDLLGELQHLTNLRT